MAQGIKPSRETRWKTGPGKDSDTFRKTVLAAILDSWPTYPSEIVKRLNLPGEKADLLLVKYHVDQLAKDGHIRIKKIDRATVCWPANVEETRFD
jgi:hypothetical protein